MLTECSHITASANVAEKSYQEQGGADSIARTESKDEAVTYSSPLMASMHESMEDLYHLGLVDKATMREFDESCLTAVPEFGAAEIKALRKREQASQAVLARYLGVSLNAVGQWERGERKASGAAAKLLALVQAHGLSYIR